MTTTSVLTWDRFPGRWLVRVSEGNGGGLRFWGSVIDQYTGGQAKEVQRAGWRVYSFATYRKTPAS